MKAWRMTFTTIFTYAYHQHAKHFVTKFIKTPHIYENIAIWPRDYTKETVWGNIKEPRTTFREIFLDTLSMPWITLLLKRPTKILKPLYASLFGLLPSDILADIDIWLSSLKHCDKFKNVISHFWSMCKPVLFIISHNLLTPYPNLRALRWYKKVIYD